MILEDGGYSNNISKIYQYEQNSEEHIQISNMIHKREDTIQSEDMSNNNSFLCTQEIALKTNNHQELQNTIQIIPQPSPSNDFKSYYSNKDKPTQFSDKNRDFTETIEIQQDILQRLNSPDIFQQNQFQSQQNEGQEFNGQQRQESIDTPNQILKKPPTLFKTQSKQSDIGLIMRIRKKMVNFYQSKTSSGRRSFMKDPLVRSSINDLSDIYIDSGMSMLQTLFSSIKSYIFSKRFNFIELIPLFNPQHPACFIINIIYSTFNFLFYILYSCLVVFQSELPYQNNMTICVCIIWVIEIAKKLNTSIYTNMNVIKNRNTIVVLYLKNEFIFDLLAFIIVLPHSDHKIINTIFGIISFLKLKNVLNEIQEIEKQLCIAIQKYYYIQLTKLIVKIFLIGHFIASMWYLIGQIELYLLNLETTWYEDSIGADGTWWKLYLQAFYWSLTLMATGSNEAKTPLQIFFTSFIMLFITIIFGYFLSMIGVILSESDEQEENKRRDINIINKYMRKRNISKVVNLDLEYYYQKNYKKVQEENQQVLTKISFHLSEQLKMDYFGRIIHKIGFLNEHFSPETIKQLCLCCEEQYYLPNQIIFSENDNQDISLMYIVEGSVELSRQVTNDAKAQKIVGTLEKDSIFGQLSFFTGYIRQASAKSTTFTTILKISRNTFLEIVKKEERDYEQLCLMKDNILNYSDYKSINQKCKVCHKYSHFETECPIMHFDKEEMFSKVRYYEKIKQTRGIASRKTKKSKSNAKIPFVIKSEFFHVKQTSFDPVSYLTVSRHEINEEDYDKYEGLATRAKAFTLSQSESHFNVAESALINNGVSCQNNNFDDAKQNRVTFETFTRIKTVGGDNQQKFPKSNLANDISYHETHSSEINSSDNENDTSQEIEKEEQENPQNKSALLPSQLINMVQFLINSNNQKTLRTKPKKSVIQTEFSKDLGKINEDEKRTLIERHNRDEKIMWFFDMQKDFQYYFPDSNLHNTITNHNRYLRQKIRNRSMRIKQLQDSIQNESSKQSNLCSKKIKSLKKNGTHWQAQK